MKMTQTKISKLEEIPAETPFQMYYGGPEVFVAGNLYKSGSDGTLFRAFRYLGSFDQGSFFPSTEPPRVRYERPTREVCLLEKDEAGNLLQLEPPAKVGKISR